MTFADNPTTGIITVKKYDDYTGKRLRGAVFEVYARNDIVTGDGTVRYRTDDLVDTITVDQSGVGTSEELFLGDYYVVEAKAPEGFMKSDKVRDVTLSYEGEEVEIVYEEFEDRNSPTEVELYKDDIYCKVMEGVKFRLKKIKTIEGTNIHAVNTVDSGEYITDADGKIDIKYLMPGVYEIKEIETLPGYFLDEEKSLYFTVTKDGDIYESKENGDKLHPGAERQSKLSLNWTNDTIKIEVSKLSITGTDEIPGAKMQILTAKNDFCSVCSSCANTIKC